jgi:hypothetical protein
MGNVMRGSAKGVRLRGEDDNSIAEEGRCSDLGEERVNIPVVRRAGE